MRLSTAFDSPEPSPATSGGCSRQSPTATTSSRFFFRTGRIAAGSGGWSRWRRSVVASRALDLACGTGDITFALQDAGASSVGLDITARMVTIARGKQSSGRSPAFIVGDMMTLPFPARDVRCRHDRLRDPQRAGDRAVARRDRARPSARWRPAVARLQPPVEWVRARRIPCLPHGRRIGARARASRRSRHLPLYSRVDPALSGR